MIGVQRGSGIGDWNRRVEWPHSGALMLRSDPVGARQVR